MKRNIIYLLPYIAGTTIFLPNGTVADPFGGNIIYIEAKWFERLAKTLVEFIFFRSYGAHIPYMV